MANAATVQPSQGVKGSLVAPSAAAPSATVGATSVSGLPSAGATTITNSGLGTFAGSTVSGINLGAPLAQASARAPLSRSVNPPSQPWVRPSARYLVLPPRCK